MISHHYHGAVLIAPECEKRFFLDYRRAFPEEVFDVFTLEQTRGFFEFDVVGEPPVDKTLLPYLRKMTAPSYKSPALQVLMPQVKQLENDGFLRRKKDPRDIFCGRTIIIRGYYSGKPIAEALQDLPNISLNWDIRRPGSNEEPISGIECADERQAFTQAVSAISYWRQSGVPFEDIYLRYEGEGPLPPGLSEVRRIHGPYAPSEGKVVYIETPPSEEAETPPFDDLALAELHMVGPSVAKARAEEDERAFLRHANLRARFVVKKGL